MRNAYANAAFNASCDSVERALVWVLGGCLVDDSLAENWEQ